MTPRDEMLARSDAATLDRFCLIESDNSKRRSRKDLRNGRKQSGNVNSMTDPH